MDTVRPAPLAAASQGRPQISFKAYVLGLIVFLEIKNTLLLQLQFGATLGAGCVGFVKLKERGEVGHFVAVVTLYRYCRIDRIIRIKAGAATKPRTANCEVHLTGVFASGRSAAAYFPYPRVLDSVRNLSMLI